MNTNSGLPEAAKGRKSAYVARNRLRILLAAQEVMAEFGQESTVEAVSERAEIAVSTIYKHFETRDSLFEEALIAAFYDWEIWALAQLPANATDLEIFALPARLLLRIPETHPIYAKLIASQSIIGPNVINAISEKMHIVAMRLVASGTLKSDDIEIRLRNLHGAMVQAMEHRLANPTPDNSEVDRALEIALEMVGLSPSQAKKLCTGPLTFKL